MPGPALSVRTAWWLVAAATFAHAWTYLAPFEDAFITYRYAEHLARGEGFAFNAAGTAFSERVDGFTSMSWMLLLAGARALGGTLPLVGPLLSLLATLALLDAHRRLLLTVFPQAEPRTQAVLLATSGFVLAASSTLAYYSSSGMETTAFAWLVQCALWLALTATPRAAYACGAVLALAATTRPEGFGYAVVVIGALLVARGTARDALRALSVFVLCILPYQLWRTAFFGYPMPNTYYAKAELSGALLYGGALRLLDHLLMDGFLLAPIAVALLLWREGRSRRAILLGAMALAGPANLVAVGGDTFMMARFLLPSLPAFALVILLVLPTRGSLVAAGLVGLASLVSPYLPPPGFSVQQPAPTRALLAGVERLNRGYIPIGKQLARSVPASTTLAVNAAGLIPYHSGLPTLDMLGLNDRHIAHTPITLGSGYHGHEKHDAAYVLSRRPDMILPGLPVVHEHCPSMAQLQTLYARTLRMLPGDRELLTHPTFKRDYRVRCLPLDDGGFFTAFVRTPRT